MTPREILNEIKWRDDRDMSKAEIWYKSRNTKEGFSVITGDELTELGKSFFSTEKTTIPFYKIFRITYEGKVIFDRDELGKRKLSHI